MIYPEGTRSHRNSLGSFKKGAFEISITTGIKVQPIVAQKYYFIDHDAKVFGSGKLKIKILKPVKALADETVEEYSMRIYNLMNEEFQNLNKEFL